MLGHLRPASCGQNKESKARYQHLYCSICAGLRSQNNSLYTAFINNEMTLVIQALYPYLKEVEEIKTPCPSALYTRKNQAFKHPVIDCAADISVLLAWLKISDWATDSPAFHKKIIQKQIDKKCEKLLQTVPPDFKKMLLNYSELTLSDCANYPVVKAASGLLSEQCFLFLANRCNIPDTDNAVLADLFRLSGEFVSLADHLIDYEDDLQKNQYNPILHEEESVFIENYQLFRQEFHRIEDQILKIVYSLGIEKISDRHFVNSFQQSIFRIAATVDQKSPTQLNNTPSQEMLVEAAGCTGETCANSADSWMPMLNNCDNCDSGCNDLESNCSNCSGGCDNCSDSCNDFGDGCDSCTFFKS